MWLQEIPWLLFKDIQVYPHCKIKRAKLDLCSDDSGLEVEMEGPSHPAIDGMAEMRQQFQMLQAQLTETKEKLANIEQKDKEKSFTQTWQESATP